MSDLPHTYIGADGQTYEILAARPLRRWLGWREFGRIMLEGVANVFGVIGGLIAAGWMAAACLAAGPLGWIVAIVAVPFAFFVGVYAGMIGGFAAIALTVILILDKL